MATEIAACRRTGGRSIVNVGATSGSRVNLRDLIRVPGAVRSALREGPGALRQSPTRADA